MKKKKYTIDKKQHLILLLFPFFLLTCNKRVDQAQAIGSAAESAIAVSEPEQVQTTPMERKLIKEGNIAFETNDLSETARQIGQAMKKYQAYIASETENNYSESLSRTIIVRVNAKHFDSFIQEVTKGVNHFETKNIQVKDITEEFVDIQARLTTKKELEQRYRTLLQRANKVTEILEIEKQLADVRAEIESIEGRLRYLANQSAYSTLSITYYKTIPKQIAFGQKFKQGFANGWQNFIWFTVGLINIWPFLLLVSIGIFFTRRWLHKRKMRKRGES
ncbi:DUF4349 domain-containing protein [Olivibacter sp. CPCC 100613]|uniref:DUF4349 domain-containing protein n=1 Tax=Olivibacter sp. CPCC 100613 TaxID=3079931 RepID=UPI002FF5314A